MSAEEDFKDKSMEGDLEKFADESFDFSSLRTNLVTELQKLYGKKDSSDLARSAWENMCWMTFFKQSKLEDFGFKKFNCNCRGMDSTNDIQNTLGELKTCDGISGQNEASGTFLNKHEARSIDMLGNLEKCCKETCNEIRSILTDHDKLVASSVEDIEALTILHIGLKK